MKTIDGTNSVLEGLQGKIHEVTGYLENQCGDPVETANGQFIYETTDLLAEGRGLPLKLERVYRSRSTRAGALGRNWSMPLVDTFLTVYPPHGQTRYISMSWGNGTMSLFRQTQTGDPNHVLFEGVKGEFGIIRNYVIGSSAEPACADAQGLSSYALRVPDGTEYYFCPPTWYPGLGTSMVCWLRKVADPYGNAIAIRRTDRGVPYAILDTLGRTVSIASDTATGRITQITDWTGRSVNYTYDSDKGDLLRADLPSTLYFSGSNQVQQARPYEAYTYWETPAGWANLKEPNLNHNLKTISRSGGAPAISLEYYTDINYEFDKVKSHTIDGRITSFHYVKVDPVSNPDPLNGLIDNLTQVVNSDGTMERHYHCDSVISRSETLNGRFDATGTLIAGSAIPGAPSAWMKVLTFNSDFQLLSLLDCTSASYPVGRRQSYEYDSANLRRLCQANVLTTRLEPDASMGGTGNPAQVQETHVVYEPVFNRPVTVVDPTGRVVQYTYGHQELAYSALLQHPKVATWGMLPLTPYVPGLWGLGDVNSDGQIGGTFERILTQCPETQVSSLVGPGTVTQVPPVEIEQYNSHGQLTAIRDTSGVWTALTYALGFVQSITLDPGGIAAQTTYQRDALGRTTKIVNPVGTSTKFSYDARDLVLERKDVNAGYVAPPAGTNTPFSDEPAVIEQHFYDLVGREIAYGSPFYGSQRGTYQAGLQPSLSWLITYDSQDTPVEIKKFLATENGGQDAPSSWHLVNDGRGRILTVTGPSGAQDRTVYDPQGRPIEATRWIGQALISKTSVQRDIYGQVTQYEAPTSATPATFIYDGIGRLISQTDLSGLVTINTYDVAGRITRTERKRGSVTVGIIESEYDSLSRCTQQRVANLAIQPDGTTTTLSPAWITTKYGYGAGRDRLLWTQTDATGTPHLERRQYDTAGRLTGIYQGATNDLGVEYVLDQAGRVLQERERRDGGNSTGIVSPADAITAFEYNPFNRVCRRTSPRGDVSLFAYTAEGRLRFEQDAAGRQTGYQYNSDGGLTVKTEYGQGGLQRESRWNYNVEGNPVAFIDPAGAVTTFGYDALGRQNLKTYPDQSTEAYAYDAGDRILTITRPGGATIARQYDALDHVTALTAQGGGASVTRTYGYNAASQLSSVVEQVGGQPTVSVTRRNRAVGETLEETVSSGSWGSATTQWSFGGSGETRSITYSGGQTATFQRDGRGRISSLAYPSANAVVAQLTTLYGLVGPRQISLGGLGSRVQEYDPEGRVVLKEAVSSGGALARRTTYAYGPQGNLSSRLDSVSGRSESFQYDGFDRLKQWTVGPAAQSATTRLVAWQWDSRDNISTVSDSLSASISPQSNALNQYTSFAPVASLIGYDPRGNESTRTMAAGTETTTWDSMNRMLSLTVPQVGGSPLIISFEYDGFDRVVSRSDSLGRFTRYTYSGAQILQAVDSVEGATDYLYCTSGASPIAAWNSVRGWIATDGDPFGNTDFFDQPGSPPIQIHCDPFGLPRTDPTGPVISQFPLGQSLLFGSAPYDIAAKRVQLGARNFDPVLGRFASRDSLGEVAGHNLYSYAKGNPFRWHDRSGLRPEDLQKPGKIAQALSGSGGGVTWSKSGDNLVINGDFGELLDEYITQNSEKLNIAPGTKFDELSASQRVRVLSSAVDDTINAHHDTWGNRDRSVALLDGLSHLRENLNTSYLEVLGIRDEYFAARDAAIAGAVWVGEKAAIPENLISKGLQKAGMEPGYADIAAMYVFAVGTVGVGEGFSALSGVGKALGGVKAGGRLGSAATRAMNGSIATKLEAKGWKILNGGGKLPEEFIPGPGGARRGSSYPDITATKNGSTIRVNTVDVKANGLPTKREMSALEKIGRAFPNDGLFWLPKH